jgi:hypothetical protein
MSERPASHSLPEFHPSSPQQDEKSSDPIIEDENISPYNTLYSETVGEHSDDVRDPWSTSRLTAAERVVNGKVAIPRLDRPVASHNGRVTRACHNCHKQKSKCSGHRPSCMRCQEINIPCVYVDGKRERYAKYVTFPPDMTVAQHTY